MEHVEILNHEELVDRITFLRSQNDEKERALKTSIKEIIDSFDQMTMIKSYVGKIAADTEIKSNLARIGVNIGVKFLLKKFFNSGKNKEEDAFPEYFFNFSRSLIIDKTPKLIQGIKNLVKKKDNSENQNIEAE